MYICILYGYSQTRESTFQFLIIPQGTDTGGRGAPSDPGEFGVAWCCRLWANSHHYSHRLFFVWS